MSSASSIRACRLGRCHLPKNADPRRRPSACRPRAPPRQHPRRTFNLERKDPHTRGLDAILSKLIDETTARILDGHLVFLLIKTEKTRRRPQRRAHPETSRRTEDIVTTPPLNPMDPMITSTPGQRCESTLAPPSSTAPATMSRYSSAA